MISSSYYPPNNSNTGSSNSTPQRTNEIKSKESSVSGSPNFYEMPTTEILSSATTRSAFLQSLQRSRKREERREKELEIERQREKEKFYNDNKYDNKYGNYNDTKYDNKYDNKYDTSTQYNTNNAQYITTQYDNPQDTISQYGTTQYNTPQYNTVNTQNSGVPSNLSTPIMSRRRLSSSPAKSVSKSAAATPPIKPLNSATPVSQSKLASHAFTMSRSSTEDEIERKERDGMTGEFSDYNVSDFKRKYEEEFANKNNERSYEPVNNNVNLTNNAFHNTPNKITPPLPSQPSHEYSDLKSLIDSVVESHTLSLKNDLQNLHIELIKQSVAQQSAFRSLLETYLPLTGKLMENLREEREENGRLKMRIEELSRRF